MTPSTATAVIGTEAGPTWYRACALDDLEPLWGEAALIGGEQVALFRLSDGRVLAVTHRDPATASYVMARGIVGSRGDRLTIASPLHKQVYDLVTGECLSSPALHLRTFPARVVDGAVEIGIPA
ncbi:nitrite reductase small subunit NirD [Planctomonas psychrotolerans]|uniref:nitrite reductase small subunit NirD n=1 Tax=Planctomonas psychrotolerans TaxID=2528712 RepID=UPI00123AB186|nr:nitrite reductase small subunit NirD [Planctomonas psychrotolerans]